MKKLFKLLFLAACVAGVTWLLRDQLVPGPAAPTAHPPPFRHPPEPPEPRPTGRAAGDDLTEVKGIGPVYARKLNEAGVATFDELATADADILAAATEISRERLADWIIKAAELA